MFVWKWKWKWLILGRAGLTWTYRRQYASTSWQLWDSNSPPLGSEAWPLLTAPSVWTMIVWKKTRHKPLLWQVDYNCIKIGLQVLWVVLITTSTMIHSDQDGEFDNKIMDALTKWFGAINTRTTSYHPASDGMNRRCNRMLISMLSLYVDKHLSD